MKLREIVVEQAILPTLSVSNRDEAIETIIDALVEAGSIDKNMRDKFVKAVITREDRASTGLGHGVAVPHVKHSAVTELRVAVAVCPKD